MSAVLRQPVRRATLYAISTRGTAMRKLGPGGHCVGCGTHVLRLWYTITTQREQPLYVRRP